MALQRFERSIRNVITYKSDAIVDLRITALKFWNSRQKNLKQFSVQLHTIVFTVLSSDITEK